MPHTDGIVPTESHTERCRSLSHPDRCLYAKLAFIRYAWSRMLCATAVRLRAVVCVTFFWFFFSYLVLSAWSSGTTAVVVRVHPSANANPKGNLLSADRGFDPWYHEWIPLPRVPLARISASLFFGILFVWHVVHMTMIWYICIEKRLRSVRISYGLGLGNPQRNVHGHIAAVGSNSSPKMESVLDDSKFFLLLFSH